jgi:hypothetical protein
MRCTWRLLPPAFTLALAFALPANAKSIGYHTPGGREIYDQEDRFGAVQSTDQRQFVVEVAVGAGPEGNLGILIGWLNQPVRGLEWYAGFGFELNPANHYTGSVRYVFNIDGYRPYIGAGYLFHDLYELGTYSHNVFGEVGYSWVLHRTFHLSAGAGVRRILYVGIRDDSPLREADVDPDLLDEQVDAIAPWVPTITLRFSRAF